MHFELTDDQNAFRDSIRRFLNDQYTFDAMRRRRETSRGTDLHFWQAFAELGLLAAPIPEWAGGLEMSSIDLALIMEEFGHALVTEPYLSAGVLAARILTAKRDENPSFEMAAMLEGACFMALALDEPTSRWTPEQPGTLAERTGAGYRLDGQKRTVLGGDVATHFIINATLDNTLAFFLVPAQTDGVSQKTYELLNGTAAVDLHLERVEIPESALIFAGDDALSMQRRILDEAALLAGAEAVGCIGEVIRLTADYLKQRQQFGQPLADFQVLQQRMADLFVEHEMARSALHGGLAALDANDLERAKQVSAARIRIDQAGQRVGNQGIHLHGGMGMTLEYPVGHLYRRLLQLGTSYGDTQYHFERYEQLTDTGI